MAFIRIVGKLAIPVGLASSIPILAPVIVADSGEIKGSQSRKIKPSELPIYEEPEEVLEYEFFGRERTSLESNVSIVRKEVENILAVTKGSRERCSQIIETGKAHTYVTLDYILDEENILPRAGAIAIGGLAGLLLGARKRGGFFKKLIFTSTGIIGAGSLCYPRHAYQVSQLIYSDARTYGAILYNFIVGVKPQSNQSVTVTSNQVTLPVFDVTPANVLSETNSTTLGEPTLNIEAPIEHSEDAETETEASSVKQEGKDVVIQLTPKTVEGDLGQSSPEDSDMYTTRS